ncbi:MAG: ribonuclease H family protein [Muribaculaceae bacterium]|jgi:caulimovirus viroplasmin|nr:ribonuclease H family protein [Muribaculaceae bacterium]
MSSPRKKFYVVWNGHHTGVFDSWAECQLQIEGFPNARYKSYPSQEEAIAAYRGDPHEAAAIIRSIGSHINGSVNYEAIPEIETNAIAVDAACSGNPGPVEYRGVDVKTGAELFRVGPLQGGSNNMGEFLALVHGLAWLDQRGLTMPVYSDSRTARAWVRNMAVKTSIAPTQQNAKIRELIERALTWLRNHPRHNRILTWDTPSWGEIPADFGRK